jgi:hypothetical protein
VHIPANVRVHLGIDDENLRRRLGEAGRRKAEDCTSPKITAQITAIYEKPGRH